MYAALTSHISSTFFARPGVNPDKIHIVPIAVNTSLYDPETTQPLSLPRGDLVFGRPRRQQLPGSTGDGGSGSEGKEGVGGGTGSGSSRGNGGRGIRAALSGGRSGAAGSGSTKGSNNTPFVFLSTFKWEMRKGWDTLLEGYLKVRGSVD